MYGLGQMYQRVTIGSLPDDVLLEVFDFDQVAIDKDEDEYPWSWKKLVHVCRRWRYIIFESPIRLNLRLFLKKKSPVRKLLDVWPAFPLVISFF
jgi:F-box-like